MDMDIDIDGHLRLPRTSLASFSPLYVPAFLAVRTQAEGGMGARLAADTMAEVPGQLLKYFSSQNIRPNPPRAAAPLPQPPRSPTAAGAAAAAGGGALSTRPPRTRVSVRILG